VFRPFHIAINKYSQIFATVDFLQFDSV